MFDSILAWLAESSLGWIWRKLCPAKNNDLQLGKDEEVIREQSSILAGVKEAKNVEAKINSLSDADVHKRLYEHCARD